MDNTPYQTPQTDSLKPQNQGAPYVKSGIFSFNGRIKRSTFWIIHIVLFVVLAIVAGLLTPVILAGQNAATAEAPAELSGMAIIAIVFVILLYIPFVWISLAAYAKRYHDRSKSGWWILLSLVPIVGLWVIIECGFLEGTAGYNEYGAPPVS